MTSEPSPNGDNGRDASGRFVAGNAGGPGNPHSRRTAAFRRTLLEAVTEDDLLAIVKKLVELARGGELAAIKELLDRLLGKSVASVELLEPEVQEFRVAGLTPEEVRQDVLNRICALIPNESK